MGISIRYLIVVGVVITTLGVWSHQRNELWRSEINLTQDCINKSPNKIRPYINLSAALILDRQFDRAAQVAQKGLKLDNKEYILWYHVGVAKYLKGDSKGAYPYAYHAATMFRNTVTLTQLGLILKAMGWKPGDPTPEGTP